MTIHLSNLGAGRLVVAMVHAMSRCREKEKRQIAIIKDAQLPIDEWWSFIHPADQARIETYAPDNLIRHSYAPEIGIPFQAVPIGERFILVGGGVADRIPELFGRICQANTRRYIDLEFHLPLDAIGTNSMGLGRAQEAIDNMDKFRMVLVNMQQGRSYGSELHFFGERDIELEGRPKIFLNWYHSTEEMTMNLMPIDGLH